MITTPTHTLTHIHTPSLSFLPPIIFGLLVKVSIKPLDTFLSLPKLAGAVLSHFIAKKFPLPQQHLVLVALEPTEPRGDRVRHLSWFEVARTEDVYVVILAKECSFLRPAVPGAKEGYGKPPGVFYMWH